MYRSRSALPTLPSRQFEGRTRNGDWADVWRKSIGW